MTLKKNKNVCIVGLGFVGLSLANVMANRGFKVFGVEKNSEIMYIMSSKYKPNQSHGIRWNDNQFNIKWPLKPTTISKKDRIWLDFNAKIK